MRDLWCIYGDSIRTKLPKGVLLGLKGRVIVFLKCCEGFFQNLMFL